MILSTTTSVLFNSFGYKNGIETIAQIGFDALDLNMCDLSEENWNNEFSEENYIDTCKMLCEAAQKNNLYFNQAHSPFPSYIFGESNTHNELLLSRIIRSIKIAGLVGAKYIVVHPTECPPDIDEKKFNIDFYNSLIPYCKEYNVKIALENLWRYDCENDKAAPSVCSYSSELADYYESLDPQYFGVCLDVGHCEIVGEAAQDAIISLGHDRLHALHIHDNNKLFDLHTVPYQGKLDWDKIMSALARIGYEGDFTYEVGGVFLRHYENKPELLKTAFTLMEQTGRDLIAKFTKEK